MTQNMSCPFSKKPSLLPTKKRVILRQKRWQIVDSNNHPESKIIKLYSQKEMKALLHTGKFVEETEKLLQKGEIDETFYFRAHTPFNENSHFWTDKALDYFLVFFSVSHEEESEWSQYFYFLYDSIGQLPLAREIARRYNIKNPNSPTSESKVTSFFTGFWTISDTKDRPMFLLTFEEMKDIKEDIVNNIPIPENIRQKVNFDEYKL